MIENKTEIYIGTRVNWEELQNTLNRSVSRLNQKLTKQLRDIAMKKGIKKTEQGKRLELYSIYQDELDTLMNNPSVRPLVKVNSKEMRDGLHKVNNSYPSSMDNETYWEYQNELERLLVNTLVVIGEDKNERKKPNRQKIVGNNPYKVGDWIDTSNQHCYSGTGISNAFRKIKNEHNIRLLSDAARVYRVSDSSYWLEVPILKKAPDGVSNWEWADVRYNNLLITKGCDTQYQHDWDWSIPYEGNEDEFEFIKSKTPIRFTQWDINYPNLTEHKGYRCEYSQSD